MSKTSRPNLTSLALNIPTQDSIPKANVSKSQRSKSVSRNILPKYSRAPRNSHYYLFSANTFGNDAPHFTIPSSRRDSESFKEKADFPGPGSYEPFGNTKQITSRIAPSAQFRSMSLDRGQYNINMDATLTSNIDFIDKREFPESKPAYIGVRTKHDFYDIIESPGPSYIPPQSDSKLPHRILSSGRDYDLSITREKTDPIGPGTYDAKYTLLTKREPSYDISKTNNRYDWMTPNEGSPGPGFYSPVDVKKNEPQSSIGKKSRPRKITKLRYKDFYEKIRENESRNVPKDLIAVDQFIIHLEILKDPKACRSYVVSHPQLRNIVHQIIELVLQSKPDNPVAFIEQYFKDIDDKEYGGMYQASKEEAKNPNKVELNINISDSSDEEEEVEKKV